MESNPYSSEYPMGPMLGPFSNLPEGYAETEMIKIALGHEITQRYIQGNESRRVSKSDILYAMEKWTPEIRCRINADNIDPYIAKLEKDFSLVKLNGEWQYNPDTGEY